MIGERPAPPPPPARRLCAYCGGVLHSYEGLADRALPGLEFCDEACLSYFKAEEGEPQ